MGVVSYGVVDTAEGQHSQGIQYTAYLLVMHSLCGQQQLQLQLVFAS